MLLTAALAGCNGEGPQQMTLEPERAYVDARTTLLQAADSADPVARAHAMEAIARTLGAQAGDVLLEGLNDDSPVVRFAAAMAIGDVGYKPAAEKLLEMAREAEPDRRVLPAILYALHELGDDRYATHLARLLFDKQKEVRANAALAMGKMGEPSAIEPLRKLLRDEQDVGVQMEIVEAMAALGNERSRHMLEAYTKTQFMDDRLRAIQALSRVRPPRGATPPRRCGWRRWARWRRSAGSRRRPMTTASEPPAIRGRCSGRRAPAHRTSARWT